MNPTCRAQSVSMCVCLVVWKCRVAKQLKHLVANQKTCPACPTGEKIQAQAYKYSKLETWPRLGMDKTTGCSALAQVERNFLSL